MQQLMMSSEAGVIIYREGTFTASALLSCLRHLLTVGYGLLVLPPVLEPNFHLEENSSTIKLINQLSANLIYIISMNIT